VVVTIFVNRQHNSIYSRPASHLKKGMKKYSYLLLAFYLMACDSKQKETDTETGFLQDSVVVEEAPVVLQINPDSKLYVWKSSPDYTKTKNPGFSASILNADSLIKGLNELNENVLLEKIKVSRDTIYTEVKDSKYLSESMGSTGAEMYVADVVLNLTEIPGINYVNIQLEEGSHMQPGVFSRDQFKKYKPKN
jgi:spore germination protein GerM